MSKQKKKYQKTILSLLLNKYERSKSFRENTVSKQRSQFTIKTSKLAEDYYDEMDYQKRELINEILNEMAATGVIDIDWVRFNEGHEVKKVYLNFQAVNRAYQLAEIVPKGDKISELQDILGHLADHPWRWAYNWWRETENSLSHRKSTSLNLDNLNAYRQLVQVLLDLPNIEKGTPKRVFSQNVLGDSKKFEQNVESLLLSILRRYSEVEYENDEEYLDSIGLVAHPKLTLLAGALQFKSNELITDTSGLPGGVGLSGDTINDLVITNITAANIITIENLTTYHQVVRECQKNMYSSTLVVYSGGFPHHGTQRLLRKVADYINCNVKQIDIYHWGDIDLGGIKIFEYIKENFFPNLKPHLMDIKTLKEYEDKAMPISKGYSSKLYGMVGDDKYSHWRPLLEYMLDTSKKLEQESIPVHSGMF